MKCRCYFVANNHDRSRRNVMHVLKCCFVKVGYKAECLFCQCDIRWTLVTFFIVKLFKKGQLPLVCNFSQTIDCLNV